MAGTECPVAGEGRDSAERKRIGGKRYPVLSTTPAFDPKKRRGKCRRQLNTLGRGERVGEGRSSFASASSPAHYAEPGARGREVCKTPTTGKGSERDKTERSFYWLAYPNCNADVTGGPFDFNKSSRL